MTRDDALTLIRESAGILPLALSEPNHVEGLGLVHNPGEIEHAMRSGLSLFTVGNGIVDEHGADPTDDQALRATLALVNGVLTMAAACVLYLEESPIDYETAKHLSATELRP